MKNRSITTKKSSQTMGAYSQGVVVPIGNTDMIFVTGQIAQDENGVPIAPDDIEAQTHDVFKRIEAILNGAGASLDNVVKVVIYVTDINDFSKISPIRNQYFAKSKPVSTLVEISATVKQGCNIEIDVIAVKHNEA